MFLKMTLNSLLKSQRLASELKKFKTSDVFDIVVYGSIVKGKENVNDIDIAVILNKKTSLDQKLKLAEALKTKLDFIGKEVDVKVIDISDLLDPNFIARQAILAEGYSLINKKFLHELFGFSVRILFKYSLSKLTYSKKKMFYYALKGRRGQKGLLKLRNGKQISDCVIEVPVEHSEEFRNLFEQQNIEFETKNIVSYVI
jgi:predicted nucleotidyltransferase